jgi:hypothetical protein
VLGPDGLSLFDQLRRRRRYRDPLDLIEHDGEDMPDRRFLDRKAALARLLRNTQAGILFDEHDGPIVFAHACRLGAEGIVSKKVDVRNTPASRPTLCNVQAEEGRGALRSGQFREAQPRDAARDGWRPEVGGLQKTRKGRAPSARAFA